MEQNKKIICGLFYVLSIILLVVFILNLIQTYMYIDSLKSNGETINFLTTINTYISSSLPYLIYSFFSYGFATVFSLIYNLLTRTQPKENTIKTEDLSSINDLKSTVSKMKKFN